MADIYKIIQEQSDRSDNKQFDYLTENMRVTNQRLACLVHDSRQPRLATEADVEPDTKTRKRTESACAADSESSSARFDDGSTSLTSFGMIAEALAPEKFIGDVLVSKGAEASKLHLPPIEVRMLSSTAGDLLPAGTVSTIMRTIFPRPLFFLEPR